MASRIIRTSGIGLLVLGAISMNQSIERKAELRKQYYKIHQSQIVEEDKIRHYIYENEDEHYLLPISVVMTLLGAYVALGQQSKRDINRPCRD